MDKKNTHIDDHLPAELSPCAAKYVAAIAAEVTEWMHQADPRGTLIQPLDAITSALQHYVNGCSLLDIKLFVRGREGKVDANRIAAIYVKAKLVNYQLWNAIDIMMPVGGKVPTAAPNADGALNALLRVLDVFLQTDENLDVDKVDYSGV